MAFEESCAKEFIEVKWQGSSSDTGNGCVFRDELEVVHIKPTLHSL